MWRIFICGLVACGGSSSAEVQVDAPIPIDVAPVSSRVGLLALLEYQSPEVITLEAGVFRDVAVPATERVDGPCTIRTGTVTATNVDVGPVGIRSLAGEMMLSPNAKNEYAALQQGAYFAAGQPIAITNATAIGSLTSATVTFPTAITMNPPPALSKAGYNVSWTGSSNTGRVRIAIGQPAANVQIACDSTTNSVAIPASALSDLVTGNEESKQITILIGGVDENHLVANGWDVRIQAFKAAYNTITFVQ